MTNETYVFGLEQVGRATGSYVPAQTAAYTSTQIGAEYQVLAQGFVNENTISGSFSPACEGGNCLIVGGGPGVTTLSIGEEDGNGEYLTRAVVDGVEFLEPPVDTFTSGGDFQFATLAIGEDSSTTVAVSAPIGQPVYIGEPSYVGQPQGQPLQTEWSLALEDPTYDVQADPAPVYFQVPEPALTYNQGSETISIPIEIVPTEQAYAPAEPIYIPAERVYAPLESSYEYGYPQQQPDPSRFTMEPIVSQPVFEPYSTGSGYEFNAPIQSAPIQSEPVYSAPLQTYGAALEPLQTVPIVEPRQKPGLYATPAPVAKTMAEPVDGRITVEYMSPRAKPPVEVYTNGSPVPYTRPESVALPATAGFGTMDSPVPGTATDGYTSVGSYDSYEATIGGQANPPQVVIPDPVIENVVPPAAPAIIYTPEASILPEVDAMAEPAESPEPVDVVEPAEITKPDAVAEPAAVDDVPEVVLEPEIAIVPEPEIKPEAEIAALPDAADEPAATSTVGFPDVTFDSLIPQIKPASIRTIAPIEVEPAIPQALEVASPSQEPLDLSTQPDFEIDLTPDFDLPLPGSTSNEIGLGRATNNEAPLLTEDDFRITTLALGEEDG